MTNDSQMNLQNHVIIKTYDMFKKNQIGLKWNSVEDRNCLLYQI